MRSVTPLSAVLICAVAATIDAGRPALAHVGAHATQTAAAPPPAALESCFLLFELGMGEVRRNPSEACRTPLTPASTFKVPHALAALDAGVVSGAQEQFAYDGTTQGPPSARRDHTLASALQHSVVWYFQRVAERLGPDREQAYLRRLDYGNRDSSSGLTTFWIGGSLLVTPEEQQAFWLRLYENRLPLAASAVETVKALLVQPAGVVVNAAGEQPFDAPWPDGAVVSAKTGSATDRSGRGVRWLAGHVARGRRSFVFVSCVVGPPDLAANAAIDLAARSLRDARVLQSAATSLQVAAALEREPAVIGASAHSSPWGARPPDARDVRSVGDAVTRGRGQRVREEPWISISNRQRACSAARRQCCGPRSTGWARPG